MELLCKLDWFSFTFPVRTVDAPKDDITTAGIMSAFHAWTGGVFIGCVDGEKWTVAQERGHYKNRIECPITGVSISWNGKDVYAFAELSGRACDNVLSRIDVPRLAAAANGRATRIDLAVDIECDINPSEFVAQRNDGHFKTSGFYTSETGETCYVGSRSGDRMARVYRYKAPHPRAHLLRAEAEYKGQAAKKLAERLQSASLIEVTVAAHLPFGWTHPVWLFGDMEVSPIKARAYDKSNDGRWHWLMTVCWPALKKADFDGVINLSEMIESWKGNTGEIPF